MKVIYIFIKKYPIFLYNFLENYKNAWKNNIFRYTLYSLSSKNKKMFELPKLNYKLDALEPYMSQETLEYHYGKHHQGYITNLNNLIAGTELENKDLKEIVKVADGGLYNNAAQTLNHIFFWQVMSPNAGGNPTGKIAELINKDFRDFENFKKEFSSKAIWNFASGWTWLIKNDEGKLEIKNTDDAETLLVDEQVLIAIDMWEHSYYIDTRNNRAKYLENFFHLIDWNFVNQQL